MIEVAEGSGKTEDLWTPYKELSRMINFYLNDCKQVNLAEFESLLRKYKQSFHSLLQNPPKNAKSRADLKKGMEDGITIRGIGHQILSKELYQEAVILSDMYDLNEFVALDLLCTAQIQMPYYFGLPRGLVAVLLYYDGRKALAISLRMLVQARRGVQWRVDASDELINFITSYTNQLKDNGLLIKILELLKTLDLSEEMEKLRKNVALGGPRHRRQVADLFNDIRSTLAETLFLWSAQCGLPKEPTIGLLTHLRQLKLEEDASGKADNVTLFIFMAFLSAIDLSVLHSREDGEEVVKQLPILSESSFLRTLYEELSPTKPKWSDEGLQAAAMFGLSVTLSCLRLVPQPLDFHLNEEKEADFITAAVDRGAFRFLNHKLLENELVHSEQFVFKRLHYLVTDFIVEMFSHVRQLKMLADASSRMELVYSQEGVDPPRNIPHPFHDFLCLVAKLYKQNSLYPDYTMEFWCSVEGGGISELSSYRSSGRSVALFKFVHFAGDMLHATLFVPFLDMLSALSTCPQGARNCFNMLKQAGPGNNSTLSWDHFFISFNQYYNNLRQEPPITDTIYRHRPGTYFKGITPQEIEGLQAVLRLVVTIAEYDDFSRLALCEHPSWTPVNIFLGLVACSVPIPLKATLLQALSALAKSRETAAQMWESLEASQVLVTIPSTSNYQSRGIQTELDEVESRVEEYPLTRAMLALMDVLTDYEIPRTLGAGLRHPGFNPYWSFIVNSVFLKFNARAYKNGDEKWQVCALCLKLLDKFLTQYEPHTFDFGTNNKPAEFDPPPGHNMMLLLTSKSEFLNILLVLIEKGNVLFQQYVSMSCQKYVEDCTLHCLNIVNRALTLNSAFSAIAASASSTILTNLNKLLMMINPRSGYPDYCLNIAKYLMYQAELPNHSLVATKILLHVTSTRPLHSQFLNVLFANDPDAKLIRNGFVEALDVTLSCSEDGVSLNTKESILKLLKQCLPYTAPNFTHFLLGFSLKYDVSQTVFQLPGVSGFPRTCIHSLFTLLRSAPDKGQELLLESAYNMLYLLCADHKTSEPMLRFLRLYDKFFEDHLRRCIENANDGLSQLNQLSWLLKTIAIELKIASVKNEVFHLKKLCHLLVGVPESTSLSHHRTSFTIDNSTVIYNLVSAPENLVTKILSRFNFEVSDVISPKWEHFDVGVLDNLLTSCQTDTEAKLIDIKKLHHIVMGEVANLQGNNALGQRQMIFQEVQKVLLHAVNVNNHRNTTQRIVGFVDAWRQVVEVLAIYIPFEVLSAKEQQSLYIDTLDNICNNVRGTRVVPEVASYLSGASLMLVDSICRCHDKELKQKVLNEDPMHILKIEERAESLKLILNYLIEWLMSSDPTSQSLRINLYATLVRFLRLIHINPSGTNSSDLENSFYVSRLDSSTVRTTPENVKWSYLPADVFSSYNEKLIEVICNDCMNGHEACKMLAMSVLSLLISITGNVRWIVYMAGRGYLKFMIESSLNSDADLKAALEQPPSNVRPLYCFSARMGLLSQFATTKIGSELLLEHSLLSCLGTMKVFDLHPEILKHAQMQVPSETMEDLGIPVENRYLQIFLPTLDLCNTIITTLGTRNKSAVIQVVYYLISHLDVVELILQNGSPLLANSFLEELDLLTSVIARTASNETVVTLENQESLHDVRAQLYRIQKLMLALLPKFLLSRDIMKELTNHSSQEDPGRLLHSFSIVSNIVTYARNLISTDSVNLSNLGVIFQPSLGHALTKLGRQTEAFTDKSPTLGVIAQHLINCVAHYHEEKCTLDFLQRKVSEIPQLGMTDLQEFCRIPAPCYDVDAMREVSLDLARDKLAKKQQDLSYCSYMVENFLYLLWAHLDYYMLRAIPKVRNTGYSELSASIGLDNTLASASEATWKVSTDDISSLKQGLVSIFNDSFSKQLVEVTQGKAKVSTEFTEALLRKIKRLIQFVPVK